MELSNQVEGAFENKTVLIIGGLIGGGLLLYSYLKSHNSSQPAQQPIQYVVSSGSGDTQAQLQQQAFNNQLAYLQAQTQAQKELIQAQASASTQLINAQGQNAYNLASLQGKTQESLAKIGLQAQAITSGFQYAQTQAKTTASIVNSTLNYCQNAISNYNNTQSQLIGYGVSELISSMNNATALDITKSNNATKLAVAGLNSTASLMSNYLNDNTALQQTAMNDNTSLQNTQMQTNAQIQIANINAQAQENIANTEACTQQTMGFLNVLGGALGGLGL